MIGNFKHPHHLLDTAMNQKEKSEEDLAKYDAPVRR